jgi:biotin synthase
MKVSKSYRLSGLLHGGICRRASSLAIRNNWTKDEIQAIYDKPFMELIYEAATVHRKYFNPKEVQQCTLLSIKTGGCVEDCKYCSQSSRYKTFVKPTPTMKVLEVVEMARRAKEAGSTRFCMGAAWRDVGETKDRKAFGSVLEMVRQVRGMGLEVCCTLGMLTADQALQLKEAGLTAYNHNLDTSREFYPEIISTRSYDDRLQTIENVRAAGISVCSGGIIGLGEKSMDRVGLLHSLATMSEHPESVPINALVEVSGTPLGDKSVRDDIKPVPPTALDMARMIATARIVMPRTMVRLSAGRMNFSFAEQSLMFMAGANSIFYGEQLLTTPNPETDNDKIMFAQLGLQGKPPHTAPLPPLIGHDDLSSIHIDHNRQRNEAEQVTEIQIDHVKQEQKRVTVPA